MFQLIDEGRRQIGSWFDVVGYGKDEAPFRLAYVTNGARLRAYEGSGTDSGLVLLIVSAPFKGPYIWDLMPDVSVIRRCLEQGIRVYLIEWTRPTRGEDALGLRDYSCRMVDEAVEVIVAETGQKDIVLAGHSLGGTFAAIYAAFNAKRVRALVLVDAPLRFGNEGGPIARIAKRFPGVAAIADLTGSPIPGSVLTLLAVSVFPEDFLLKRYLDLVTSLPDPKAMDLHLRVVRWTLDEFPMPRRLFEETLALLYCEDRFARNRLELGGDKVGLAQIDAPMVTILNSASRVVPEASANAAVASAGPPVKTFVYEGSRGSAVEHVGPLVSPRAHAELWPEVLAWMLSGEIVS